MSRQRRQKKKVIDNFLVSIANCELIQHSILAEIYLFQSMHVQS